MIFLIKGFGLLSVATLVSDFVMLYIIKQRKFYQKLKVLDYKNDVEVIIFNLVLSL
jgi:hypothetical protein